MAETGSENPNAVDSGQVPVEPDQSARAEVQTASEEQPIKAVDGGALTHGEEDQVIRSAGVGEAISAGPRPMELLMDVELELSVELGRTSVRVKELLDFAPGTVVELDRFAEDPVDVLVNGKLIARGEIVVVDDCLGVKISEIAASNDAMSEAA